MVAGTTSLSTPGQRNNGGQQNELNVGVAGAVGATGVRSVNTTAATDLDAGVAAASSGLAPSNPELRVSFDGLRMIDSRLADGGNTFASEPPDQGLCAGNGFVLESINNAIRVYDTNGVALSGVISHNTFYGYPPAFNFATGEYGPSIADPYCYFDTVTAALVPHGPDRRPRRDYSRFVGSHPTRSCSKPDFQSDGRLEHL
jgi:hypothetical protein